MLHTIALLEVDNSLIYDTEFLLKDLQDNKNIIKQVENALNTKLIKALKDAEITDIYLFSDATFDETFIREQQALITILQRKGFIVHGVITSADCSIRLSANSDEIKSGAPDKAFRSAIKELENFKENSDNETCGPDFGNFEGDEEIFTFPQHNSAKKLTERTSQLNNTTVKSLMFQYFLKYLKKISPYGFNTLVVCDNNSDNLKSIKNDPTRADLICVEAIHSKDKSQNKDYKAYLKEITEATIAAAPTFEVQHKRDIGRKKQFFIKEIKKQIMDLQKRLNKSYLSDSDKSTSIKKMHILNSIYKQLDKVNLQDIDQVKKMLDQLNRLFDNRAESTKYNESSSNEDSSLPQANYTCLDHFQYGMLGEFFASVNQRNTSSGRTKTNTRLLLEDIRIFLKDQVPEKIEYVKGF